MGEKETIYRGQPLLLGVMGDPIGHTKSPALHEAALTALSLQGSYVPLHVTADRLQDAVTGIVALGFRGVNVTVPHKVNVMKYVHHLDEGARHIGAVNTIINNEGILTGTNTDGIGYVRSLKEEAISDLSDRTILVIGAGGAARGIIYALLQEKPGHVIIANRTEATATRLAEEWSELGNLTGCAMEDIPKWINGVDILINTTSVGMYPNINDIPVDPELIPRGIVVSDLIYNPMKTELLRQAELRGCRVHGGLGMFVYQGAYAFEYWTGVAAPIHEMRQAVLASLQI